MIFNSETKRTIVSLARHTGADHLLDDIPRIMAGSEIDILPILYEARDNCRSVEWLLGALKEKALH